MLMLDDLWALILIQSSYLQMYSFNHVIDASLLEIFWPQ